MTEYRYVCEEPGVPCLGFRNITGRRLSVMPPGGTVPMEVVADGRVLIPVDQLASAPDLVHWLIWLSARRLIEPTGPTESVNAH